MARAFAEIAFTPSVRAVQERQGSAKAYSQFLESEAERGDRLGPAEMAFIAELDGFYQATVSETGWPYVQFRGGPAGFVKVLDEKTIAYADFRGNRQYISAGNLAADDRLSLILVDYPNRRRLKLWGRARLSEDLELINRVHKAAYRARPEHALLIAVVAFDWNCPQHIPQRLTVHEFAPQIAPLQQQIADLRAENEVLRQRLDASG